MLEDAPPIDVRFRSVADIQMEGQKKQLMAKFEWHPAPPTLLQRVLAALCVSLLALASVSSSFDWDFFGAYDLHLLVLASIIGLALLFWWPGLRRS